MKKIKYGIIGAGTMAREHILNISLIDNAEVVALADPHEDSLNQCKEILKTKIFCFKKFLNVMGGRNQSTLGMEYIYGELECRDFDSFNKSKFFRPPMKTKIK